MIHERSLCRFVPVATAFFAAKRIFAFLSGNTFLCKEQISIAICSRCIDKYIIIKYNKVNYNKEQ